MSNAFNVGPSAESAPITGARSNVSANLVVGQKHPSWDSIEPWQRDALRDIAASIGRIIDENGIVGN